MHADSEESVRVVKSAKTRAFEAFESTVKALRMAMRINDHQKLMDEYDVLSKAMVKATKVFSDNGGVPRFLVRILVDLDDHVQQCLADKAAFKKLKPAQGRALNRMKLSIKKYKETYNDIMEEYRKNPVVSSDSSAAKSSSSSSSSSSSDSSDSEDDDYEEEKKKTKTVKTKVKAKKNDSNSVSFTSSIAYEYDTLGNGCRDECILYGYSSFPTPTIYH